MHDPELASHFEALADGELVRLVASRGLTEFAQAIAEAELLARGIAVPERTPDNSPPESAYQGDRVILVRGLTPADAHVLCSLLNSVGIAADAGDANFVQANALLSLAVGGVSIRVPSLQQAEAAEVVEAFRRGDFSLNEDFDANG